MDGFRYEIKFPCPAAELPVVESWARSHPAGFRTAYPPRQVNNIYFDTHTLSNVDDGLAGLSDRAKLRLRWYGADATRVTGVLELKEKRGSLGRKTSRRLAGTLDLETMAWPEILARIAHEDLGPLDRWIRHTCCPTVINHYWRRYCVSADGLVRLTLDTRLAVFRQHLSQRPNLRRVEPRPPILVVELKADAAHWERLRRVVAALPARPMPCSKYGVGVLGDSVLV